MESKKAPATTSHVNPSTDAATTARWLLNSTLDKIEKLKSDSLMRLNMAWLDEAFPEIATAIRGRDESMLAAEMTLVASLQKWLAASAAPEEGGKRSNRPLVGVWFDQTTDDGGIEGAL